MAAINGTIKLSAPISPYDTNDTQPTHEAKWGKGGYRSVQTLIERDLIPDERREIGMVVFVQEDERVYSLKDGIDNSKWVDFESFLAGSQISTLFISPDEPKNPDGNVAWLNTSTGILFYRDQDNTYWIQLTSGDVDGGEF